MLVKEKYSGVSESYLFELQETKSMGRKHYYAFWCSVKNIDVKFLKFEDLMYLSKIEDAQAKAFKRPTYK